MIHKLIVTSLTGKQEFYYRKLDSARQALKDKVIDVAKTYISFLPAPTHTTEKVTPRSKKTVTTTHNSYYEVFGADYYALFEETEDGRRMYISGIIETISPPRKE